MKHFRHSDSAVAAVGEPVGSIDGHSSFDLSTRRWRGLPDWTLLIHGIGDGGFVWDSLIAHLLPDHSAITVDLRGHGSSPHDPLKRYERSTHVADVVALIDRLEMPTFVLVGHSLGAEVAIRAAAARSHRIRGLVIVDGGPGLSARAAQALRENLSLAPPRYASIEELIGQLTERHPFAEARALERYASSALEPHADGGFALRTDPALWTNLSPPDETLMWEALHALTCPKLLVRGAASSVLTKQNAEQVRERLQNCRIATVLRAGHAIPLDNPAGLSAVIKPFLAEAAPSHRASRNPATA